MVPKMLVFPSISPSFSGKEPGSYFPPCLDIEDQFTVHREQLQILFSGPGKWIVVKSLPGLVRPYIPSLAPETFFPFWFGALLKAWNRSQPSFMCRISSGSVFWLDQRNPECELSSFLLHMHIQHSRGFSSGLNWLPKLWQFSFFEIFLVVEGCGALVVMSRMLYIRTEIVSTIRTVSLNKSKC